MKNSWWSYLTTTNLPFSSPTARSLPMFSEWSWLVGKNAIAVTGDSRTSGVIQASLKITRLYQLKKGSVVYWGIVTNARFLLTGKLQERFDWPLLDWVYRQTIEQLSCLLNQWRNTLSLPTSCKSTGASGEPSCFSEFFPPWSTLLPPSLPCTDTSSCLVTPSASTPQTAKTPSAWRKYGQRVQSFLSQMYKMQYFFW